MGIVSNDCVMSYYLFPHLVNEYYCVTCHVICTIAKDVGCVDMHMVYLYIYITAEIICSFCANSVLYINSSEW